MKEYVLLQKDTVQKVLDYLVIRPYREVFQLVTAILEEANKKADEGNHNADEGVV